METSPSAPPPRAEGPDKAVPDFSPPALPDHDLLHVIGRGAYGEVWLARHTRLGTLRAIKIIRRDHFGDARPFQREFDGIRRYEPISRSHPNLVSILHVGGRDECFYYVVELADDANAECRVRSAELALTRPADPLSHPMGEGRGEGEFIPNSEFRTPHSFAPHTLRSDLKRHGVLPIDRC